MSDQAQSQQPSSTDRSSAFRFAFKAAVTTIGGGLLTLSVAVAQIWYSKRLEFLNRQSQEGLEFQAELLQETGAIHNSLADIVNLVKRGSPAAVQEASSKLNGEFEDLYRSWAAKMLLMRNRGAQIYGREVGHLIYDSSERAFGLDHCNVAVTVRESQPLPCDARRAEEARYLGELARLAMQSGDLAPFRNSEKNPQSFHQNAALTRAVAHRYVNCLDGEEPAEPDPRCQSLPETATILLSRLDLLRLSRENLANRILARTVAPE